MSDELAPPSIHPTAIVHPTACLGPGSMVAPFAVIEEEVVLGTRCSVGSHGVIKKYTRMGDDNRICEGAVLGGPPQDLRSCPDKSFLVIGNGNVFRENLTINRSSESDQATRIGNGNYFMAYSHVAHDCVIEDCIVLANNSLLAGFVRVEDHAFISGGVVVHQHNQIGRYSMIGGNSKVMQDALPFFLIDGFPARIRGLNTVGLERGGFSRAEVQALRQALRTLRQTGMKLEEKLEALAGADSESVGHLVDFIRRSTRGFCRVHR